MAHKFKPEVAKVTGIPIAVVHEGASVVWEVQGDAVGNPRSRRFVAHPVELPMREWKNGIMFPAAPPPPQYFDGRLMRDQFMGLRTDEEILGFLNLHGRFSSLVQLEERSGWARADLDACQKVFAELAKRQPDRWQEYADNLMSARRPFDTRGVLSALNWGSRRELEFRWSAARQADHFGSKHLAVLRTRNIVSAILATIEIDHLRGAKFGVCARADCPRFFEVVSRHARKYCTQYCAHLESVRRTRARQKKRNGK